jgi:hypothetical protein
MIVPARDVFWCHAGDDRFTHTTPLARELNCGTIGFRVGEGETLEGRSPTNAINDGLRASTCVLVVTEILLRHGWRQRRLNAALARASSPWRPRSSVRPGP